jgi:hypothetical protein
MPAKAELTSVRQSGGKGPMAEESTLIIVRCPIHGIAFDVEREQCPECAKG